jgi:hypothetical protein
LADPPIGTIAMLFTVEQRLARAIELAQAAVDPTVIAGPDAVSRAGG